MVDAVDEPKARTPGSGRLEHPYRFDPPRCANDPVIAALGEQLDGARQSGIRGEAPIIEAPFCAADPGACHGGKNNVIGL